jgi:hypothetical protein
MQVVLNRIRPGQITTGVGFIHSKHVAFAAGTNPVNEMAEQAL